MHSERTVALKPGRSRGLMQVSKIIKIYFRPTIVQALGKKYEQQDKLSVETLKI
jgi:hypothetical protein